MKYRELQPFDPEEKEVKNEEAETPATNGEGAALANGPEED